METEKNEEKVPFEIALHNLRYQAAEAAEAVIKAKKKALLILIIAAVILIACGAYPVFTLFHTGRPVICALAVVFLLVLAALTYFISGWIYLGKDKSFFKLAFLYNGWRSAVEDMDEVEEMQLSKKVFDKDIEKTEDRLIAACEKLVNEYNKSNKD